MTNQAQALAEDVDRLTDANEALKKRIRVLERQLAEERGRWDERLDDILAAVEKLDAKVEGLA